MSAFSYISFPREVDKSCLISKFNESKHFLVGEIRGTEIEKQYLDVLRERSPHMNVSLESIRQLPDNMSVYLGDESDFHGITINDKYGATFNGVFTNQFIYSFTAGFKPNYDRLSPRPNIIHDGMSEADKAFLQQMKKNMSDNDTLCRQQLYEIVILNIKSNEIVEIYTDWVDNRNIFDFGPPEDVIMLDAEQILSSELLGTVMPHNKGFKIEIHRPK